MKIDQGLRIICELHQKFTVKPQKKSLSIVYLCLNLFIRFYLLFQATFLVSISYYAWSDFSKGYQEYFSVYSFARFIIIAPSIVVTGIFLTSFGIFWLQMYIVVAVFNRIKIKEIRKSFLFLINNCKGKNFY